MERRLRRTRRRRGRGGMCTRAVPMGRATSRSGSPGVCQRGAVNAQRGRGGGHDSTACGVLLGRPRCTAQRSMPEGCSQLGANPLAHTCADPHVCQPTHTHRHTPHARTRMLRAQVASQAARLASTRASSSGTELAAVSNQLASFSGERAATANAIGDTIRTIDGAPGTGALSAALDGAQAAYAALGSPPSQVGRAAAKRPCAQAACERRQGSNGSFGCHRRRAGDLALVGAARMWLPARRVTQTPATPSQRHAHPLLPPPITGAARHHVAA